MRKAFPTLLAVLVFHAFGAPSPGLGDGYPGRIEAYPATPALQGQLDAFSLKAGWFRRASGFLIGRPLHMGEEVMGLDMYEAAMYHLRDLNVPVVMDLDIGHLPPAMPLICGARAKAVCRVSSFEMTMERD